MKLRRRPAPLLLFLIPAFTSLALAADARDAKGLAKDRAAPLQQDPIPTLVSSPSRSKDDVGTKDAPIDGLDGKPHKGPFLVDNSEKKPVLDVEDLVPEKSTPASVGPNKLVEEDGVMNDRNRNSPKKGTTGTEGGVSEKTRDRKAKEDEFAVPTPPKEAPPLPHSEQERLNEKLGLDDTTTTTAKALGAVGLEVSIFPAMSQ